MRKWCYHMLTTGVTPKQLHRWDRTDLWILLLSRTLDGCEQEISMVVLLCQGAQGCWWWHLLAAWPLFFLALRFWASPFATVKKWSHTWYVCVQHCNRVFLFVLVFLNSYWAVFTVLSPLIDNYGATERHSISGCLGELFHATITWVAKLWRVYLRIILARTKGETGLELFSIVPASIGD